MHDLARKIKQDFVKRKNENSVPSAIFGSIGLKAGDIIPRFWGFRIAIYPILSSSSPQTAMGIAAVCGLLFEQYRSTRVYRIFSKPNGIAELYRWSIEKSQFTMADWSVDGLDNNINISGSLEGQTGAWQLRLDIQSLQNVDEGKHVISITESSLALLINKLSDAVDSLATKWEMSRQHKDIAFVPPTATATDADLTPLLETAFTWENQIFLSLWGMAWDFTPTAKALLAHADSNETVRPFGAWLVGALCLRLLIGLQIQAANDAETFINQAFERFPNSMTVIAYLAIIKGLMYEEDTVYSFLEAKILEHPQEPLLRSVLARFYLENDTRYLDALDTYQTAIDEDVVSMDIYRGYAALLSLIRNRTYIETFVFINPNDYDDYHLQHELIQVHQIILDAHPEDVKILSKHLSYLLEFDDDNQRIWDGFKKLIALDKTGQYVREFIDNTQFLSDIQPAITLLRDACRQDPTRVDFHINLAAAYLADEDEENALNALEKAQKLTDDPVVLADIDRLGLVASDPEFELSINEMMDIVNSGNELSSDDIDYLEGIIARVPTFAEGYILTAKTYIAWDEYDSALDVLMDGHKHLPDDPEIARLLGEVLAHSEEYDLALEYLKKGLAKNQNYVPLLATMGLHLFEDGRDDEAKSYLSRAEQLSPHDLVFKAVKAKVARLIMEDKD